MKTTKTYLSGCTWCSVTGFTKNPEFNPNHTGSTLTTICPVCHGTKTVLITEITES